jgi:rod shape-determining protein MreC
MSRERLRALLPFLLFFIALAGFVLHRVGWLEPVESVLVRVTTPLQKGMTLLVGSSQDLAQTARDLRDLRQRNQELEADNARLLLENLRLKEVQHEAVVCSDLLDFAEAQPAVDVQGARVVGRVIGRDPSNLQRTLLLDTGREAGIGRNMPVVTDRGLVGRIAEVGDGWSRVLLILDVSSSVNALAQSTRATGLVEGRPDGSLVLRDIPQGDTVSVGDMVFTSGLGGNFPSQILIGQITGVQRKDSDLYQVAAVRPTVDFDRLEQVMVVVGFKSVEEKSQAPKAP